MIERQMLINTCSKYACSYMPGLASLTKYIYMYDKSVHAFEIVVLHHFSLQTCSTP